MNRLLMMVAAGATLAIAGTANAQYSGQYGDGNRRNNDWSYQSYGYDRFEQQYRHTIDGIRHGLSDGSYSRSLANEYFRELQNIRRDAYRAQQYGNYRDEYVQARMARLHQRMHRTHDRAHDRNDEYGQYDRSYGGDDGHYHDRGRGDRYEEHDDDD